MRELRLFPQRKTRLNARGVTLIEVTIALAISAILAMGSAAALQTFATRVTYGAVSDAPFESFRAMAFMTRAVQLASYAEVDPDNRGFLIRLDYQWVNNMWQYNNTLDQGDDTWLYVRWVPGAPSGRLRYIIHPGPVRPPMQPGPGATVVTELPASNVSFTMVNPDQVGTSTTLRLSMTLGADAASARHLSTDVIPMRMSS